MENIGIQEMKYALLMTKGEGAETIHKTSKEFIGKCKNDIWGLFNWYGNVNNSKKRKTIVKYLNIT